MSDTGEGAAGAQGGSEQSIRKWLKGHGAPLELRTARAFAEVGADVQFGRHYIDKETGQPVLREIDVVASFRPPVSYVNGRRSNSKMAVTFVIECKASKHQWVALTNGLPPPFAPNAMTERVYHPAWDGIVKRAGGNGHMIKAAYADMTRRAGYAVHKAHSDSLEDAPYGAMRSVCKAARWMATDRNRWDPEGPHLFCPVIVVGQEVWCCFLEKDASEPTLERVETLLPVRVPVTSTDPHRLTMIDLVPHAALGRYAERCAAFAKAVADGTG
jgi:hypothetical protein